MNPLLNTDSYKLHHRLMYPNNTTLVYSNWTPRSARHYQGENKDGVVVFGIQSLIKKLILDFDKEFFELDRDIALLHYGRCIRDFTGDENYDVSHIGYLHDLGYLPLVIKALPEGSICPIGVPALTVYNTDPECFWLTNYLETLFSSELWPFMTNASIAREYRQIMQQYGNLTGVPEDFIQWQCHDFSSRGLFGSDAWKFGMGHLTSFTGTDTIPAFVAAKNDYNAKGLVTGSVPACFPDGAEILTDKGFLDLRELSYVDLVAQYTDEGNVEFVKCSKIHEYDFKGSLLNFKSGTQDQINFTVTPNHRIPYINGSKKLSIKEASELGLKPTFIISGKNSKSGRLSDYERLLIAFQADGSYSTRNGQYTGLRKGTLPMRFPTLKKKRKIKRLKEILKKLKFKYTESFYENKGWSFRIEVPFNNMLSKTFDWVDISKVSSEWAKEFIEELQYWDGNMSKKDIITYSSINKDNTDVIQALASISSIKTHYRVYNDKRVNRKPLHNLTITLDREVYNSRKNIEKTEIYYKGKVRCVSVPSGMFIARQHDRVIVSGNSEHSIQCSHYTGDGDEKAYVRHMLDTFPTGIISIVCDGFDYWKFVTEVLPEFKDEIMARDGRVVIRPDSGSIVDIICGTREEVHHMLTDEYKKSAAFKGSIETLYEIFGGTEVKGTDGKMYKHLDPHIGLIYGDSVTIPIAREICDKLVRKGFSTNNLVLGIGSYTYQYNTRDTFGFAMKATYIEKESKGIKGTTTIGKEIFKDPKTKGGMNKKSLKGLIKVDLNEQMGLPKYEAIDQVTWEEEATGSLREVFRDGKLLVDESLETIRERVKLTL